MVEALHVANNILERAFKEERAVSPMKLQKLIYFIYKRYLQNAHDSLFNERFEAWKYGPVVLSVYHQLKKYGSRPIKDFYRNPIGEVWKVGDDKAEFSGALDAIWQRYKGYNGIDLSALTHQKNTAWYNAMENGKRFLDDDDILAEEWFS
ncbi:MAG: DUF4065 domain-containing protein [Clostridiales bacterium]|jgi:uncharacterized phage-associated protein|nr:DUF4065 domain-containing protein [Clostridiales bacterium]